MKRYYKVKNSKLTLNYILILCIVFSTMFLSIGYSQITSSNLNIMGTASTSMQQGMFISHVEYVSNVNADLANSKIIDYTGTMLHSDVYLSSADSGSSITYRVTIFNNSDAIKKFTGVTYDSNFYSNNNIKYRIDGMQVNDTIAKGSSKTFNITYYYGGSTITSNNLNSYLSFNFDYYMEGENEVDIAISQAGSYTFAGVSPENPISLLNIANIKFRVMNGCPDTITALKVDIGYTTTTGSTQTASVGLYDGEDNLLESKEVTLKKGSQLITATFDGLNIQNGSVISVKFDKGTINNGKVNATSVVITPIF